MDYKCGRYWSIQKGGNVPCLGSRQFGAPAYPPDLCIAYVCGDHQAVGSVTGTTIADCSMTTSFACLSLARAWRSSSRVDRMRSPASAQTGIATALPCQDRLDVVHLGKVTSRSWLLSSPPRCTSKAHGCAKNDKEHGLGYSFDHRIPYGDFLNE
jgi:hypothetical protein